MVSFKRTKLVVAQPTKACCSKNKSIATVTATAIATKRGVTKDHRRRRLDLTASNSGASHLPTPPPLSLKILRSFFSVQSCHVEGAGVIGSVRPPEMVRLLTHHLNVRGKHFVDLGAGYGNVVAAAAAEGAASAVGYELLDGYYHYAPLFPTCVRNHDLPAATTLLLPCDILALPDLQGPQVVFSASSGMPPKVFYRILALVRDSQTVTCLALFRYDGIDAPELRQPEGYMLALNQGQPESSHFSLGLHTSVSLGGGSKQLYLFRRPQLASSTSSTSAVQDEYEVRRLPRLNALQKSCLQGLAGVDSYGSGSSNSSSMTRTAGRKVLQQLREVPAKLRDICK